MCPGVGNNDLLITNDAEILVGVCALDLQQRRADPLKVDRIEDKASSVVDDEARLRRIRATKHNVTIVFGVVCLSR